MELSPKVKQVFYCLGCLLNMMSLGAVNGFPAILVPAITARNDHLMVDKDTATWIAAVPGFASVVSVLLLAPSMHIFGRKVTNICLTSTIILGWILIFVSNSLTTLIIGRFLSGLVCGATYFFSVCIGELTCPAIRGSLLNSKLLGATSGVTLIHTAGCVLHWKYLALVGALPSMLALVIILFWPNTPDWLVSKGKFEEAEIVFYSLRGSGRQSFKEITKLIVSEKKKQGQNNEKKSCHLNLSDFKSKSLWRPVCLLGCALLLPELGGRGFIPSYSLQLFADINGQKEFDFKYTLITDILSMMGPTFANFLVFKFPRRKMILGSGFTGVFLLTVFFVLMVVKNNYIENAILHWAVLAILALYTLISFGSLFNVCYMIMGELFPLRYREIGSLIDGLVSSISFVIIFKIMPILCDHIGVHGMFSVFSLCTLMVLIYLYYDLPETKDRTLQDIGDYFQGLSPKIRCFDKDNVTGVDDSEKSLFINKN